MIEEFLNVPVMMFAKHRCVSFSERRLISCLTKNTVQQMFYDRSKRCAERSRSFCASISHLAARSALLLLLHVLYHAHCQDYSTLKRNAEAENAVSPSIRPLRNF